MMNQPQFYLIWKEGSCESTPTYKHEDYENAKTECERLTRIYGGTFHVLAHVATAKRNDIFYEEVDSIPF